MRRSLGLPALVGVAVGLLACSAAAETVWLDSLDIRKVEQDWGAPKAKQSVDGNPLSIAGQKFERGLGTHAASVLCVDLKGGAERFKAFVGVDDEVKKNPAASVEFLVTGDGKLLWKSGVMKAGQPAQKVDVDLRGGKTLLLKVDPAGDGINYDHADWADAQFEVSGPRPETIQAPLPPREPAVVLTPKPPAEPRINSAKGFGVRPGSPFLYTIAATGERPMEFAADGLPAGLQLDAATAQITGVLKEPGEHVVTLRAKNAKGATERKLKIVVGERIALTPPLGWNSWNCWAGAVDAAKVLRSARAMASSGLIQHGWTYINIDDTWQGERGGPFKAIQGNKKFPDMKGLCDEIHRLGLKAGIYSTPWVTSYAGFVGGSSDNEDGSWDRKQFGGKKGWHHGKFPFASNDAKQWAVWGFDYLKYDWNPNDVPHVEEMAKALRESGRDIVYSLSNGAPFQHAADWARLANCWRTTGDITDTWRSMSGIGFQQDKWTPFGGPGHWNDPDMLVVGEVGWGPRLHPTRLSPNEQYTHISLWCLLSAPMLLGCDLEKLDEFTLNLLTNDEVLDVNQDPLGKQASRIAKEGDLEVWAKDMEDGSKAVGFFNRSAVEATVAVKWTDLGIQGKRPVRDLWRQKNLGEFENQFEAKVPYHGVVLVRIGGTPGGAR